MSDPLDLHASALAEAHADAADESDEPLLASASTSPPRKDLRLLGTVLAERVIPGRQRLHVQIVKTSPKHRPILRIWRVRKETRRVLAFDVALALLPELAEALQELAAPARHHINAFDAANPQRADHWITHTEDNRDASPSRERTRRR